MSLIGDLGSLHSAREGEDGLGSHCTCFHPCPSSLVENLSQKEEIKIEHFLVDFKLQYDANIVI
jgi:hypothetical protein